MFTTEFSMKFYCSKIRASRKMWKHLKLLEPSTTFYNFLLTLQGKFQQRPEISGTFRDRIFEFSKSFITFLENSLAQSKQLVYG